MRFDTFLSEEKNISRNKAKELIESKKVLLNDLFLKPSFDVLNIKEPLKIKLLESFYQGRAAYKLRGFLSTLKLDFIEKTALDIGSASGGFVEFLLELGFKITAVDVGKGQMKKSLISLVELHEQTDIRAFKSKVKFELITADLSFISLIPILPFIDALATKYIILLFKPQFEVGRELKRSKKGVLKNEKSVKNAIEKARNNFELECSKKGWSLIASKPSVLKGKEGNLEYFYAFKKS